MKRLLVVIALLALVPLARAAEEQPKKQTKGRPQAAQHAARAPASAARVQGTAGRRTSANFRPVRSNTGAPTNVNRAGLNRTRTNVVRQNNQFNVGRRNNVAVNTGGNRRFAVVGGRNYASFGAARQWNWHQRHDRGWWASQGFPLVLYGGGYWYWNNGWWYPAYGYDPYYSNYVYDGPIYGYGNVAPGDVTSEVQQALAQQGYYQGPIDGILGPMTRSAIARFQADRGLATTAAIDQPTLASLGLA
jgi:hypothetical protein